MPPFGRQIPYIGRPSGAPISSMLLVITSRSSASAPHLLRCPPSAGSAGHLAAGGGVIPLQFARIWRHPPSKFLPTQPVRAAYICICSPSGLLFYFFVVVDVGVGGFYQKAQDCFFYFNQKAQNCLKLQHSPAWTPASPPPPRRLSRRLGGMVVRVESTA